ncbi:hypothetical protein SAMN04489724_4662 [Algoriphagus locisalis]|uniref:Uncharacterized protein n=1 Tax=Algoriphagus locisalis TaxID=305507 RepID=A0A1I7E0N6_9BACT|nr:hypothetical protein SAMN04489724_4662 [Algoriphagus locisalis]
MAKKLSSINITNYWIVNKLEKSINMKPNFYG